MLRLFCMKDLFDMESSEVSLKILLLVSSILKFCFNLGKPTDFYYSISNFVTKVLPSFSYSMALKLDWTQSICLEMDKLTFSSLSAYSQRLDS